MDKTFSGKEGGHGLPAIGKIYRHTRIFTRSDILEFAHVTGDRGIHHTAADKPVIAHGLLVASIVTKIGGDMNYVARTMEFEMLMPVYQDETVTGFVTVASLVRTARRLKLTLHCQCVNAAGKEVLSGSSRGLIWLNPE